MRRPRMGIEVLSWCYMCGAASESRYGDREWGVISLDPVLVRSLVGLAKGAPDPTRRFFLSPRLLFQWMLGSPPFRE